MRSKENAHDYRFFPEPDLPPFIVNKEKVKSIQEEMPQLSKELFDLFTKELGLSVYDANIISEDKYFAIYFQDILKNTSDAKAAANWLIGPVKSFLNEQAIDIKAFPIKSTQIAEIIKLIEEGKLNFASASSKLFPALLEDPAANVLDLATRLNIIQNSDLGEIEKIVDEVLAENITKVQEYKDGKKGLMGMFMGQIMKKSGGKADPKIANQLLTEKLK